jgi:hypothetical protein
MNTSQQLALAHLCQHKGKASVISIILALLIFLPTFTLSSLYLLQKKLTERAQKTPLLLAPAQGKAESLLHHLHFQLQDDPIEFTPTDSFDLFDGSPLDAIPIFLAHQILSKDGRLRAPLLCSHAMYLEFRKLAISSGKKPEHPAEIVIGSQLAKKWSVNLGDHLRTSPHRLLDLSKAHQLELLVVGILEPTGGPEDLLAITPLETAWIKLGLGHGHPKENLKGVPKTLHMSIHSEQKGYRRINQNNREEIHFHQPKSLLPLTAMILLPADEKERLYALAWGQNHPTLEVIDPISVTERILSSLHQLGDILLLMLLVVSLTSLVLMGLFLRMNFIMRKRDAEILEEMGIPSFTFATAIAYEWLIYIAMGGAMALILMSFYWFGGLTITELMGVIRN